MNDNKRDLTFTEKLALMSKLNQSGGGGGESGYSITAKTVIIAEQQTVTAIEEDSQYWAEISISSDLVKYESITVIFDGVTYDCPSHSMGYGAPFDEEQQIIDFSEFPFVVCFSTETSTFIGCETGGDHTISITGVNKSADVTEDFRTAVQTGVVMFINITRMGNTFSVDRTFNDVQQFLRNGGLVIAIYAGYSTICTLLNNAYLISAIFNVQQNVGADIKFAIESFEWSSKGLEHYETLYDTTGTQS